MMKKQIMIMGLAMTALLCGCGRTGSAGTGLAGGSGEETGISNGSGEDTGISNETEVNSEDAGTEGRPGGNGTSTDGGERVSGNGKVSGKEREAAENGGETGGTDGETAGSGGGAGGRPEASADVRAAQGGSCGEISVILPEGWKYEGLPMDSEELISGDYGIHFYPEGAAEGFIEIAYNDFFGVCGTGLAQEEAEMAGSPVSIGTYDGHAYWDFVRFGEQNEGVVALTYRVEDWWDDYKNVVSGILDTLSFERDIKEGGRYVFREESENREIGLYFSLKNISSTGATLVYNQFDAEAPTGRLQDGDDFAIERYGDGNWEEVPVTVKGDYGFHDIAYVIPNEEITERELSWEWLYGQLAPGEYRIEKIFLDFRETADYDEHVIYAYFNLE